ncbi:hypothetical protein Tco_0969834 [Tanacetum coccineum]
MRKEAKQEREINMTSTAQMSSKQGKRSIVKDKVKGASSYKIRDWSNAIQLLTKPPTIQQTTTVKRSQIPLVADSLLKNDKVIPNALLLCANEALDESIANGLIEKTNQLCFDG